MLPLILNPASSYRLVSNPAYQSGVWHGIHFSVFSVVSCSNRLSYGCLPINRSCSQSGDYPEGQIYQQR